ncbi:MAG: hypothetical protein M3Q69_11445 [Acidobacteriota bacterium]|nr:hypothetical protein [Acidobacteriota bacterium]
MRNKIVPIALASALVFGSTAAHAYEVQRLRDGAAAPVIETQQSRPSNGATAPNVFGSTTSTPSNANTPADRALTAQIRTLQRQYRAAVRAHDPRAEQYRVELERLKAQRR